MRYVNYYDIFVRHAFGNFRDVLREVRWLDGPGWVGRGIEPAGQTAKTDI